LLYTVLVELAGRPPLSSLQEWIMEFVWGDDAAK
jgi:hypothetical protein